MRKTIQLFWSLRQSKQNPAPSQSITLPRKDNTIDCDVFIPGKSNQQTLIFMHGMSPLANQDPRLRAIAERFSTIGFTVVLPRIDSIAQLLFDPKQIDLIADSITLTTQDKTLCPSGKVSVFSISFTSSLVLCAIVTHKLQDKIKAMISLSFIISAKTTVQVLSDPNHADKYSHYIAMKNIYHLINQANSTLDQGFDALISDEYSYSDNNNFDKFLNQLPADLKKETEHLFQKIFTRDPLFYNNLIKQINFEEFDAQYPFKSSIKQLNINCYILHALDDPIFKTKEILSCNELNNNSHFKILITPLLDHANLSFSIRNIIDLFKLFNLAKGFLSDALRLSKKS